MHQPVFKSVPSLPLFVVEPRRKRGGVNSTTRSDSQQVDLSSQPISEITTPFGGGESEFIRQSQRRSHRTKSKSSALETKYSSGPANSEVLVHGSKQRWSSHKSHRRHKTPTQSISNEGDLMERNLTESTSIDPESPLSDRNTNSNKALFKEIERLTSENSELTKRLQSSELSQDSGYQPSASERNSSKEAYVNDLLSKLSEFEQEFRKVERQRDDLRNQLAAVKKQRKATDVDTDKIQTENQELHGDVLMLKNLVYRLNLELEKYQERLRKHEGQSAAKTGRPDSIQMPDNGVVLDKDTLGPLLEAYDETIHEKDDLIRTYEKDLNNFVAKCKEVVVENENLHQELEDASQKVEATTAQFNTLKHEASVAQEQNNLLIHQLQVQKEKVADMHTACQNKVAELMSKNDELIESFHHTRGDYLTLQGSYSVLREEYDKLRKESENKIPFSVHSAAVTECRRLFDELKQKYEVDKNVLTHRVEELSMDQPQLQSQVLTLRTEVSRLEFHADTMDKLIKKTQQKCDENQKRWVTAKITKDAVKRQLQKAIAFAEELIQEQEKLVKQLYEKQEENQSMFRIGSSLVNRMGSLKSKLKDVQKGAWQELDTIERRIAHQENGVGKMKEEYHRETGRLQNLVKQKEAIITRLQQEKSKTDDDLEVVWRAAMFEDKRIKEKILRENFDPVVEPESFQGEKY